MGNRIRQAQLDEDKPIGSVGDHAYDTYEPIFLCHLDEPFRSILILGWAIYEQQFDSETD